MAPPEGRLRRLRRGALCLLAVLSVACSPADPDPPASAPVGATPAADSEAALSSPPADAAPGDLAGTSWRLVNIMSMDDTVYTPEDPSAYTLEFGRDGTASVRADCNRAKGSWTSDSPGQLQFGPMAGTRAACPPGSLHDRYLGQFEWVRSYVTREGHLFLATMADGAIIEFEPL